MIDGITILNNVTVSDFNPIPWLGVFIGLTVAYIIIYIKYDKFDKKDVRGVWYAIFGITLILLIADIRFSKVDAIQCTIEDYVSINEVISVIQKRDLMKLMNSSLLNAFSEQDYFDVLHIFNRVIERLENIEKEVSEE